MARFFQRTGRFVRRGVQQAFSLRPELEALPRIPIQNPYQDPIVDITVYGTADEIDWYSIEDGSDIYGPV